MKVLCIAFIVASLVSLAYAQELVCGDMATNAGRNLNELYCPPNMFFRDILFSSFGSPTGSCSTGFSRSSSCDYSPETVRSIISTACLGRNACRYFPIERHLFGNIACATSMRLTLRCAYPTVSADICLMAQAGTDAIVECPIIGNTFTYLTNSVTYASYGTPCFKQYLYGSCHLSSSLSYITSRCVGQQRCTFPVDSSITDPCPDLAKTFVAKANCSNTGKTCTMAAQGTTFDLMCQPGSTITGIEFASYGNAYGNCSSGITTSFCHDDYYNRDYFGDSYLGFFGSPGFTTKESCNSTSKTLIIGGTCRG